VLPLLLLGLALASPLDPAVRASLDAGEVVILPRQEGTVRAVARVAAPPEVIWRIVSDPQHIRASSPTVKELLVRSDGPGADGLRQQRLGYTVKAGWSEVRYNVVRIYDPGAGEMRWSLDASQDNDIKATDGRFALSADPAGGTLFTYELRVELGKAVPAWIQAELTESGIKRFLEYVQLTAPKG
jgi:hypothetical protein